MIIFILQDEIIEKRNYRKKLEFSVCYILFILLTLQCLRLLNKYCVLAELSNKKVVRQDTCENMENMFHFSEK
jgi:hypothetical protein